MKKMIKLLSLFVLVLMSFELNVDASIKESDNLYIEDTYVIGYSRFSKGKPITAFLSAEAGQNYQYLNTLLGKSFKKIKSYMKSELDGKWYDLSTGMSLNDSETREFTNDLNIYYIDGKEKVLEIDYDGIVDAGTLSNGVKYENRKFKIPSTLTGFTFERNGIKINVSTQNIFEGKTEMLELESEVKTFEELKVSLNNNDIKSIKLMNDIDLSSSFDIMRNITFNLNGFSMNAINDFADKEYLFAVYENAHLVINDLSKDGNGKITNNGQKLTIIKLVTNNEEFLSKLTLNNGILEDSFNENNGHSPISSNSDNVEIVINGGKIISKKTTGIFMGSTGNITINNGYIEGATGIEIHAGELVVNDGMIKGTALVYVIQPNLSGPTNEGAGIAVAPYDTDKKISLIIKG